MFNYSEYVREHPKEYKQFSFKDLLFLICECNPDSKKSFYVPDTYLRSFTSENTAPFSAVDLSKILRNLVLPVETNAVMTAFYDSVVSYFISDAYPPEVLLELKFRELLLYTNINPANQELKAYLYKLTIRDTDDLQLYCRQPAKPGSCSLNLLFSSH
jgi:hypothetical protein